MNFYWITIILILNRAWGFNKCPSECQCTFDFQNRNQITCLKGTIKTIPMTSVDKDIQVFILRIVTSYLSELSTLLQPFKKLETLKIVESNLSSLGKYTFWGLPHLKILDLAKNNVTHVSEDNFRGQDNLLELDLSKNKIFKIPTNVFHYLKVN